MHTGIFKIRVGLYAYKRYSTTCFFNLLNQASFQTANSSVVVYMVDKL